MTPREGDSGPGSTRTHLGNRKARHGCSKLLVVTVVAIFFGIVAADEWPLETFVRCRINTADGTYRQLAKSGESLSFDVDAGTLWYTTSDMQLVKLRYSDGVELGAISLDRADFEQQGSLMRRPSDDCPANGTIDRCCAYITSIIHFLYFYMIKGHGCLIWMA